MHPLLTHSLSPSLLNFSLDNTAQTQCYTCGDANVTNGCLSLDFNIATTGLQLNHHRTSTTSTLNNVGLQLQHYWTTPQQQGFNFNTTGPQPLHQDSTSTPLNNLINNHYSSTTPLHLNTFNQVSTPTLLDPQCQQSAFNYKIHHLHVHN